MFPLLLPWYLLFTRPEREEEEGEEEEEEEGRGYYKHMLYVKMKSKLCDRGTKNRDDKGVHEMWQQVFHV